MLKRFNTMIAMSILLLPLACGGGSKNKGERPAYVEFTVKVNKKTSEGKPWDSTAKGESTKPDVHFCIEELGGKKTCRGEGKNNANGCDNSYVCELPAWKLPKEAFTIKIYDSDKKWGQLNLKHEIGVGSCDWGKSKCKIGLATVTMKAAR